MELDCFRGSGYPYETVFETGFRFSPRSFEGFAGQCRDYFAGIDLSVTFTNKSLAARAMET